MHHINRFIHKIGSSRAEQFGAVLCKDVSRHNKDGNGLRVRPILRPVTIVASLPPITGMRRSIRIAS